MIDVDRTDWAMAQQVHVGGSVAVPLGAHEVVVVISGGPSSTTSVAAVTGPATPTLDVEHFVIREATAIASNVAVLVRTSPGKVVVFQASDTGTVAARPAHGSALIGLAHNPAVFDIPALDSVLPAVQVVRFGIAWYTAQPSSSAWDAAQLAYHDDLFTYLAAEGMKAIVTCGTTPAWARTGGTILSPPDDPTNHGAFVDSIVDRWGDTILCVDPWNEPNLNSFWTGTDTQYVQLLAADRAAVDPAIPVSLGPISLNDYTYIDGLFSVGLTGAMFDYIDLHPYPYSAGVNPSTRPVNPVAMPPYAELDGSVIGGLHKVEAVLASHGLTGKSLVVSEVGVSSNPVDRTNPQLRLTDQEAAAWLSSCIDQLRRIPYMEAVCVHEAKDQVSGGGWANTFGLLNENNVRRASWAVVDAAA